MPHAVRTHRPSRHEQLRPSALGGLARTTLAVLATLALLLAGSTAAAAHDSLVSTSPQDGATVATAPSQVVLTFSDDVVAVGTEIAVKGPDGDVQEGRPRIDGAKVTQALTAGSPKGDYTVTWRATSKDGHPVSGTFRFTATAAAGPAPSRSTPGDATSAAPVPSVPDATTAATSTSGSDEGGTSWALWVVLAVLVLAGAGAVAARARRGHVGGRHG